MKRLLIFLLLSVPAALAQFTTVSGTVTDPNGLRYANGTITPLLFFSGGSPKLPNGSPYFPPSQASGLDTNGSFVVTLADTSLLTPAGSKWNFVVCSAAGTVPLAFGKGNICFQLAAPITISGSTQDISTALSAVAPALTATFSAGGTPGGSNTQLQVNNSGAFGGLTNVDAGSWLSSAGAGSFPVFQTKAFIDVRDYGVKCDGVTNDTTAMNNALAAAVAVGTSTGTAYVQIPSGVCLGNFTIVEGKGLRIQGSGQLSTRLRSPNANPALQINGLWYSTFSDLGFDVNTHTSGNAVLEIDGHYDGTHLQAVQFLTFTNVFVSGLGVSDGQLSSYAVAACRQSGGAGQCSNLTWVNSALSGASTAVYLISGFNALGNQFIGGDAQNYTLDGFYIANGNLDVYGTTFESANGCSNVINGGYDIHSAGGSFPINVITGVRTEGWTAFNLAGGTVDAFSQSPAFVTYATNTAFALNAPVNRNGTDGLPHLYCVTTPGTTSVGGIPNGTWPISGGTVTDGTVVWTEENYNTINSVSYFNSAASHIDPTGSLVWALWTMTFGNYSLTPTGLISNGTFDISNQNPNGAVEHAIQEANGDFILDLFSTTASLQSKFPLVGTLPALSVGMLTRGGVTKLYLGDNLYEGTEFGTASLAQYHITTSLNMEGTFTRSAGGDDFSSIFMQPTINQSGTASGTVRIAGIYPVLTSTRGTPLLLGVGTAASVGGAKTDFFTVDTSGNTTVNATLTATRYATKTNCAATGTAANPSVAACGSAPSGAFACDVAASAGTCVISTTAVGANSRIIVQETTSENSSLGVTCNTSPTVLPAIPVASKSAGASFTINMPTITTNPACFDYWIVNQ